MGGAHEYMVHGVAMVCPNMVDMLPAPVSRAMSNCCMNGAGTHLFSSLYTVHSATNLC